VFVSGLVTSLAISFKSQSSRPLYKRYKTHSGTLYTQRLRKRFGTRIPNHYYRINTDL